MQTEVKLRFDRVQLNRGWSRQPVLSDVTFAVNAGSLVLVAGANGSGKSTLLRAAAGASRPTAGVITRLGSCTFVPDTPAGELRLTAQRSLAHTARLRGLNAESAVELQAKLADDLGLAGRDRTRRVSELSRGTRQKVALVGALAPAPAIAILDEPWATLDPAARIALDECVLGLVRSGTTVVVVDHQRLGREIGADVDIEVSGGTARARELS